MPARRDYTAADLEAKLERDRERARVGMRELRQRRKGYGTGVSVTHKKEGTVSPTPSRTLPFGEETLIGGGGREVEAILAPFESRGYKHQPAFWLKMAQTYPHLDLELEALSLADWLEQPKNRKALCSQARIRRWLKIAEGDRLAGAPNRTTNGTTNGVYHAPATRQRTPDPEGLPVLEADLERVPLAPRREGTLKEKLAAIRGGQR